MTLDVRYIRGAEWRDGGKSNATAERLAAALDNHEGSAIFEISYDTRHELATACKKEGVLAALASFTYPLISDRWIAPESDEDFLDRVGCYISEYRLSDHVTSAEKRLEERMQELKDGLGVFMRLRKNTCLIHQKCSRRSKKRKRISTTTASPDPLPVPLLARGHEQGIDLEF